MNEGFTDNLINDLMADVEPGVRQLVSETRDDMRRTIGRPVGRTGGPRGGTILVRSKRGEAPRRDTSNYRDSWVSFQARNGDRIEAELYSDVPYGPILENKLNRPHFEPVFRRAVNAAVDTMLDGMT
jgi:hypothetical protein